MPLLIWYGGEHVAVDMLAGSAAIINANDAKDVAVWSCVVTPQIRKGSKTQRQIQGTKHGFIAPPGRTGDDQFLAR